ncbi:MAG: acyl-CoA thioester hydrolase/BAAT C-terminal domain-containing protein [Ktedonobacterales bacterium]
MGEDRSWPSAALSEIAMSRFAQHRHPHPYRHITYHNAGHLIAPPPYGPATNTIVPGPGVTFIMGGTPQDNAAARADAWVQAIGFFAEYLTVMGNEVVVTAALGRTRPQPLGHRAVLRGCQGGHVASTSTTGGAGMSCIAIA